jgi:hypothetical protein
MQLIVFLAILWISVSVEAKHCGVQNRMYTEQSLIFNSRPTHSSVSVFHLSHTDMVTRREWYPRWFIYYSTYFLFDTLSSYGCLESLIAMYKWKNMLWYHMFPTQVYLSNAFALCVCVQQWPHDHISTRADAA